MTFESAGSEDHLSANHSSTEEAATVINVDHRIASDHDSIENDHESSQILEASSGAMASCNGSPNEVESSSNLNNLRKTLSKWLRIQRPSSKSKAKKPKQRYRLMGWPPRWVRDQDTKSNQRALPPVPSGHTSPNFNPENDDERVSTPELRPEDFPPGVAYLPDGDDEEPIEFGSKSNIIDFTASIDAVKNVSFHCKKFYLGVFSRINSIHNLKITYICMYVCKFPLTLFNKNFVKTTYLLECFSPVS